MKIILAYHSMTIDFRAAFVVLSIVEVCLAENRNKERKCVQLITKQYRKAKEHELLIYYH